MEQMEDRDVSDRPTEESDIITTGRTLKETDRKHAMFRQYLKEHGVNDWITKGLRNLQALPLDEMSSLDAIRKLMQLLGYEMPLQTEKDCEDIMEEILTLRRREETLQSAVVSYEKTGARK
ncbi:uncharacterized protein LOC129591617 [Paramacrobiotus metropolitanus]|uniref:uncharacterized protein LOC129591617 n=1 Tax=Paramacrobiotus metropolitanus TaxID=2943436 RepID=UPI002445F0D7|nr:uncharacterized protein LOC129591617 [Paramacrobiotus metropolitanus]